MTTQVHIVNLGHGVVEALTSATAPAKKLYSGDSVNLYVWDGQDIVVREVTKHPDETPETRCGS